MKIGTTDLLVLLAYLAGVVLFGLWVGRRQRSAADYMVGGRNLPWGALLISIVATETSTVTFLSVPGLAFDPQAFGNSIPGNLPFLQLPMGYIVGRILVAWLLIPLYFQGRFFTAYQVLHQRFGGATQRVASLLFMVTRTLADGLRLFLSAIILSKVSGLDMNAAVLALGAATILYTFTGGLKAVVWTDVIQFIVYMSGAAIAFSILVDGIPGGWSELWETAQAEDKLQVFDFRFVLNTPFVFGAGVVGGAFVSFGTHGVDQIIVQRFLSARSRADASKALIVSGFVVLVQFAFFLMIGVGLHAFFTHHPPSEPFARSDEVFATFIVNHMPIGVLGIVLGAVFAAAMSTLSSSLNSSATAAVSDFYLPLRGRSAEHPSALRAAKGFTILFGILQITVGIAGQWLAESVVTSVLSIASFTTGLILGLFLLATFTREVRERAALIGLLAGLALVSWLSFGTDLAWPWFALVGSMTTFGVGLVANRFLPQVSETPKI